MNGSNQTPPWVLVGTGFHNTGGMEVANFALAESLLNAGVDIHLVTHRVDAELKKHPLAHIHLSPTPMNSFMLAEPLLGRKGVRVATRVTNQQPGARVLVNGGCCEWPDINWVHCVHAAWDLQDDSAPLWFKAKNWLAKAMARHREVRALGRARFIIANSKKAKSEIVSLIGIPQERVRVIYLGTDPSSTYFSLEARLRARAWLGKSGHRPIVAFVGAMGYDNNKGFDTLCATWKGLCAQEWDADLIVAGGGRAVGLWKQRIEHLGLARRITLLGFTDRVSDLLAASDLLVSPVRYESFGLNVQEALAGGVPAIVSATAGVAELYPPALEDLLLENPGNVEEFDQPAD